jgi:HPt (histidine-containing phosphotransfer) domain-containing protein
MKGTIDDAAPPHDPEAIARLRGWGGEKLVREMAALFERDVPTRLAAARAALDAGRHEEVERHAHSLKSTGAQLGALRMHRIARETEVAASAGAAPRELGTRLDRLEDAFADHVAWLRQFETDRDR